MTKPIPLLFLSDAVTAGTGLARITRDVAVRIAKHLPDYFRVGTAGYGGAYSREYPFPQYQLDMQDWVVFNLPEIWKDFAGEEKGILFTVWDASRLLWLARPETCTHIPLRQFLNSQPFQRWGYFPMDATGPNNKLTAVLKYSIEGFDRVLAYSKWAEDILRNTLTSKSHVEGLAHLPHGIDTSVFKPRHRIHARHGFGTRSGIRYTQNSKPISIPDDAFCIGIVATNQERKDYGLAFQALAEMKKERRIYVWIHVDELERKWSIPALANDFGLTGELATSAHIEYTDETMSWLYSACDVTLGIGLGEGFGYPIFESLACGVPCIHGNYGGAAEHLADWMKVYPEMERIEGLYNCIRPVHDAKKWAKRALESRLCGPASLPSHLDWNNLWPCWAEWLKAGVQ